MEDHQPCKPAKLGSNPSIGSNITINCCWCRNYKKEEAIEEHRSGLYMLSGGNIEIGFCFSTKVVKFAVLLINSFKRGQMCFMFGDPRTTESNRSSLQKCVVHL